MGNVVADCTAHIARHTSASFTAQYGTSATPATVATACGYPGAKASAWRQHLARQHGQGAVRTGHGRYPALTYAQWCKLLGIVQRATSANAKPATMQAAGKQVGAVLWAKQRAAAKQGARQAKRQQASKPAPATEATAQAPAAATADTTAQAS